MQVFYSLSSEVVTLVGVTHMINVNKCSILSSRNKHSRLENKVRAVPTKRKLRIWQSV